MSTDKAFANLEVIWVSKGGNTGKRKAEHRSFDQLNSFNYIENRSETGYCAYTRSSKVKI